MRHTFSIKRVAALCHKEGLQILRDPSSNLIAFVLPIVLLLIFGFGINLDTSRLRIGLVLEDTSPEARDFGAAFYGSPYFETTYYPSQAAAGLALAEGKVRGFVIVPSDFAAQLKRGGLPAQAMTITDGAEPNTANFVENYVRNTTENWLASRAETRGEPARRTAFLQPRFWFNPSAQSRNYLIPGSITIIMTVIGALLTSLVVAREWERGTMEALLASPVTRAEILVSKLLPYYLLGMASLLICVAVAVFFLRVPFRGSVWVLLVVNTLFLGSGLGLGLLLSTVTRNQFNAAMAALNAAFLPALILSGFIYEIRSMPWVIQAITYLVPARYYVSAMQTIFQAGNIPSVLVPSMAFLLAASVLFIGLTVFKTRRRLE